MVVTFKKPTLYAALPLGGTILGRSCVLALSLQGRTHCFPPLNARPAHPRQRSTTQQCRIWAPPTFDIAFDHHGMELEIGIIRFFVDRAVPM